jgi:hypothetical protein
VTRYTYDAQGNVTAITDPLRQLHHMVKRDGLPRGGPRRNPDVSVNTGSGDVFVKSCPTDR